MKLKLFEVFIFIVLFGFLLYTLFFDFIFLCGEDNAVEYLSVLFWFVGFLLSLYMILSKKFRNNFIVYLFLFICFISFGEELSWGQRIFDIKTPDFIAENNVQQELTLHNLYILCGGSTWRHFFKTGEFNYQQIVDAQNLFRLGFVVFFLLFPIVYSTKYGAGILSKLGYYKPENHFTFLLWLFIVCTFLIVIGKTNSSYLHSIQEIREMAFALFIGMYLFFYAVQQSK
ncbi:MAG: hypothetical protein KAJ62_01810 [Desulfobacteraceae bacterium]|nr:hypothetical protein [Desulfobacteraceae bacterium]